MKSARFLLAALAVVACGSGPSYAQFKDAPHPFILWTADEAAAIRKRIETEPWAGRQYEKMLAERGVGQTFRNLLCYQVMGDQKVGEQEKQYLLRIVGTHPRNYEKKLDQGGRHYDCYLDVLRYDVLYDRLSPEERGRIEQTFRSYIAYHAEDRMRYTRTSWLPNMQWPRPFTYHMMALVMKDQALIRQMFAGKAGFKFYFDDYIADGCFYMEEFGKQYSMIGEMLLWCRGLQRLGLDEMGYGYVGKGGATMRKYLESIPRVGYPRMDLGAGRAHYPKVTMGDAKGSGIQGGPPYLFQHSFVDGYLPNGSGGNKPWMAANMNGRDHQNTKVDKMLAPLWFEIAHAQWPDAGFDYFLAQMRGPDEDRYYPSLFFGLSPIDPTAVKAPPAPSYLARERGFAMLRWNEAPAYWESEDPAVAFQLATYYVHYVHDAFSILGLYAFNRPIYFNRGISNGYAGGCIWTDSTRGHCGVLVDNLQWQLNEQDPKKDHPHWPNPIGEVPTRFSADHLVKFVIARGKPARDKAAIDDGQPLAERTLSTESREASREIFPGVDMTRALFLTGEYLFDVYQLTSDKPHEYHWQVHALGAAYPDAPADWRATGELDGKLYDQTNRAVAARLADPIERDRYRLRRVHKLDANNSAWSLTTLQTCALEDVSQSILGRQWYDRKIGVRVSMLGEDGTRVYYGDTPVVRSAAGLEKSKSEKSDAANEVGGVTILVARNKANTTFVALHEPFKAGRHRVTGFRRIEQTDRAVAVAVIGADGINDRVMACLGDGHDQPTTLTDGIETFTFADHAYLRIGNDQIHATGDLRSVKLKVNGDPKLILNGQQAPATISGGMMLYNP